MDEIDINELNKTVEEISDLTIEAEDEKELYQRSDRRDHGRKSREVSDRN